LINGSINKWDGITELLLMYAARRDHTEKKIRPLLEEGKIVVSDRYFDSTFAYQGCGHKLDLNKIEIIRDLVLDNFKPHTTIILDLDVEEGLRRTDIRGEKNRFEDMEIDFHNRVRQGFLDIAKNNKERVKLINVKNKSIQEVHKEIINNLGDYPLTTSI
jgi:dTMP kinase